eukprot:jgi/Chlat1/4996/Chrsp32S00380
MSAAYAAARAALPAESSLGSLGRPEGKQRRQPQPHAQSRAAFAAVASPLGRNSKHVPPPSASSVDGVLPELVGGSKNQGNAPLARLVAIPQRDNVDVTPSALAAALPREEAAQFVVHALYGVLNGGAVKDVTRLVRKMVSVKAGDLQLYIPAQDKNLLFGDPAWFQNKQLRVSYRCTAGGPVQCMQVSESAEMRLGMLRRPIGYATSTSTVGKSSSSFLGQGVASRKFSTAATGNASNGGDSEQPLRVRAQSAAEPLDPGLSVDGLLVGPAGGGGGSANSWNASSAHGSDDSSRKGRKHRTQAAATNSSALTERQHSLIHPTADVHPAAGVEIGAFCTVGRHVRLGADCRLHPNSHVAGETVLGARCVVHTGAVVGEDIPGTTTIGDDNRIGHHAVVGIRCQDLKYKEGDRCYLEIGNRNDIREYASIHRSSRNDLKTIIGDRNLIMGTCHIAHDCHLGNFNIMANATLLAGHVVMADHAHTGGAVAVHQFSHVGSYAFLAGGSMVDRDVPAFMMVQGDRADLRGLNLEGMRRGGFSDAEVRLIRRAYAKLFMSAGATASGLEERLKALEEDEEFNQPGTAAMAMIESVRSSFHGNRRGICKFKHWASTSTEPV